jgi:ribosomal protein S18 acetylase RimI-like enzyme
MDFAEKTAAVEGYDCMRLDAFTNNTAALILYENRGYRKAGVVRFRKGEFYCYEKSTGA